VAFAYVADVTDEKGRSLGYGLVTAGFAGSLIISPALGAGLELYFESEDIVVILATVVALMDVVFIILFVPESLPTSQKLGIKTLTFKQVGCLPLNYLFI
jgi:MFS family permease